MKAALAFGGGALVVFGGLSLLSLVLFLQTISTQAWGEHWLSMASLLGSALVMSAVCPLLFRRCSSRPDDRGGHVGYTVAACAIASLLVAAPIQAQVRSVVGSSKRAVEKVGRDIADWHDIEHPACRMRKVVSASIENYDEHSSTELWTIEGCDGRAFQYRVTVLPGVSGGFSTMVANADGSGLHIDEAR